MTGLLTAKEKLVGFYKNYEMIVKIIAKLLHFVSSLTFKSPTGILHINKTYTPEVLPWRKKRP